MNIFNRGIIPAGMLTKLLPALFIMYLAVPSASYAESSPADPALSTGVRILASGRPAEALSYLLNSYYAIENKDSLHYLIAESLLRKGVFDTALAFNLSVKYPAADGFGRALMEQRHSVFIGLRNFKKAQEIRDSVSMIYQADIPEKKEPLLFEPAFDMFLRTGYFSDSYREQNIYPFTGLSPFSSNGSVTGPGSASRLNVSWKWRLPAGMELKTAYLRTLSREYTQDYFNQDYGAAVILDNIAGRGISLGYTYTFDQRADDKRVHGSMLDAAMIKSTSHGLFYLSIGAGRDAAERKEDASRQAWLLALWDGTRGNGAGPGFQLMSTVFDMAGLSYSMPMLAVYADDISRADEPVFCTDSTCSQEITFSSGPRGTGRMATSSTLLKYADEVAFGWHMPQMMWRSDLQSTYSLPRWAGYALSLGGGGGLRIYPGKYSWYQGSGSWAGFSDTTQWLVYNRADGRYYRVESRLNNDAALFGKDILKENAFSAETIERYDWTAKGIFSVKKRMEPLGYFSLDCFVEKIWSTLDLERPLDVPSLNYGLSLSFRRKVELHE